MIFHRGYTQKRAGSAYGYPPEVTEMAMILHRFHPAPPEGVQIAVN